MGQTRRGVIGIGATALGGLAGAWPANAAQEPRRVVSLNPCLDVILAHVADRAQIAALSHYARISQSSTIAEVARSLPYTYETAEEILALSPDLVLASTHSAPATRAALGRLGVPVADFAVPNTIDESVAQVSEVAERVGRRERGEALVLRIRGEIEAGRDRAARRPIQALIFQARGLAAGEGTLLNEMMLRCGFENVASRYGIGLWGNVAIERLIADPPELLLSERVGSDAPSWAERLLAHPALARIAPRMRRSHFPEACLYCGGPVLIDTARALARARDDFWSAT